VVDGLDADDAVVVVVGDDAGGVVAAGDLGDEGVVSDWDWVVDAGSEVELEVVDVVAGDAAEDRELVAAFEAGLACGERVLGEQLLEGCAAAAAAAGAAACEGEEADAVLAGAGAVAWAAEAEDHAEVAVRVGCEQAPELESEHLCELACG